MITNSIHEDNCVSFQGLSSEDKPTYFWLKNGSSFVELDTSKMYFYSKPTEADGEWLEWTGGTFDFMATGSNEKVKQYIGLSTDEKPTDTLVTGNGSRFIEMDTSKIYVFDAKNTQWIVWSGTGGGGSGVSAVLTNDLEAGLTVGGVSAGDTFPAGTPIEEVIKSVIGGFTPTTGGKMYFGLLDEAPSGWSSDFTEEDIPGDWATKGVTHLYAGNAWKYEVAIFPSSLGDVKAIYQNGMSGFNLLSNFNKMTAENEGVSYNVYYYVDKVLVDDDSFEFLFR